MIELIWPYIGTRAKLQHCGSKFCTSKQYSHLFQEMHI